MTEPSKNSILNERVKPAMLNPLVKYITLHPQISNGSSCALELPWLFLL
jgi:hypothetical protein